MACFKKTHKYYKNLEKEWEEIKCFMESTSPCFDSSSEEEEEEKKQNPPDPEVKKALEDAIENFFHKNKYFFAHKAKLINESMDKKLPESNAIEKDLDNYILDIERKMELLRNLVFSGLNQPIVTSGVEPVDINKLEGNMKEEQKEIIMPQKEINKLKNEIEDYESEVPDSDHGYETETNQSESSDEHYPSTSDGRRSEMTLKLRKRNKSKMKKDGRQVQVLSKLNARNMKNNPKPPKSMCEYFGNNESIGSVPGKRMKCHCESLNCRGRLL